MRPPCQWPHGGTELAVAQEADNLRGVGMGQALDVGDTAGGQRTRQNHQTDAGHAQRCRAGVCRAGKGAREHAHGWYTTRFGDNGIVETPRCTGASIRNAVDNGITLLHQRLNRLRGAGGAVGELAGVDDLLDAVLLLQDVLQLVQERIRVVLPVFEHTDDLALQAGQCGTAALDLGEIFRTGIENLDLTCWGRHGHVPPSSVVGLCDTSCDSIERTRCRQGITIIFVTVKLFVRLDISGQRTSPRSTAC